MAGYYIGHRYSDDLDFFTRERENLRFSSEHVERAVIASGLTIQDQVRRGDHIRYTLTGDSDPTHPLVRIDLTVDTPPYFAPPRAFGGVRVDDLLAIAVNKVTALGRMELKDYVDLYQIVRSGQYRLEDLIPHAGEKDPGVTPFTLAAAFEQVRSLPNLFEFQQKYMRIPIDWNEMVRFYLEWAGRLFALFPPRRQE